MKRFDEAEAKKLALASFRGSIAPASLKRGASAEVLGERRGFRGSIAPASLKLCGQEKPPVPLSVFPGLYCPGLIEAMMLAWSLWS